MTIKASLLKKIEQLEEQAKTKETPYLVMITFDNECNKWEVREFFSDNTGIYYKEKKTWINHFNEYEAEDGFRGVVIVDNLCCPDNDESCDNLENVIALKGSDKFIATTVDRG